MMMTDRPTLVVDTHRGIRLQDAYFRYPRAEVLTNASLDVCHGRTSTVPWHGTRVKIYHYVMTHEFPYTVGCYRGTPKSFAGMTITSRF